MEEEDATTQIFVMNLDRYPETITLNVKASDMLDMVKTTIQDKMGIPLDNQKLIFGRECVSNGRTLLNTSLQSQCCMYVLRQQPHHHPHLHHEHHQSDLAGSI